MVFFLAFKGNLIGIRVFSSIFVCVSLGHFGGMAYGQIFYKFFTEPSIMPRERIPIALTLFAGCFIAFRGHSTGIRWFICFSCILNHPFVGGVTSGKLLSDTLIEL